MKKKHLGAKMAEFKDLLRMNDVAGDPWGVIVGAWFDCAAHLYEKGDCPTEWQYKVGWGGNHIETDSAFFDFFNEASAELLTVVGHYLWRISEALKIKGLDY